jgi:CRP-like cAMP-binding protein
MGVHVSQEAIRKLKRGEFLFKENDGVNTVYVVQSGKINLVIERNGKKLEVGSVGAFQVLGEQALITTGRHQITAEAAQETKITEIPLDQLKGLYERAPTNLKLFIRSLVEEAKHARVTMRNQRLESDKSPLPQLAIPRIFTLAHLIPRHIGKSASSDPAKTVVSWMSFKQFAIRFFGESPLRLRQMMDLFQKLKLVTFKVKATDDGEEDLVDLTFEDLQKIEDFAEFYQFHLFKGQRAEAIYFDPIAYRLAKFLTEVSANAPLDHRGSSANDYNDIVKRYKAKFNVDLNTTHFDALEKKGLFVNRRSLEDGSLVLTMDRNEFVKTVNFWSIIHEIDKWNETGSVNLNEKEERSTVNTNGCPECQHPISKENKFCPNCGFKIAA